MANNEPKGYRILTDAEKFKVHDHLRQHVAHFRQLDKEGACERIKEDLGIDASPQTLTKYFKMLGYRFKMSPRTSGGQPVLVRLAELEATIDEQRLMISDLQSQIDELRKARLHAV